MPNLKDLLQPGGHLQALAAHLDGLPFKDRLKQALSLGRREQRELYDLAGSGPQASLEDLLPAGFVGREWVFEGRNSLPVLSRFQKRFFRTQEGRVFGYNRQSTSFLTGPGYFEVRQGRGCLEFDYDSLPEATLAGLPQVRSNRKGVSGLVYGGLSDEVRRVGKSVFIARAYKDKKDLGVTFLLVKGE